MYPFKLRVITQFRVYHANKMTSKFATLVEINVACRIYIKLNIILN